MTQEERIIKKVYEAKKVELGEHTIELALVDDLKVVINKIKSKQSEIDKMKVESLKTKKMFEDAISLKNNLQKQYESNKSEYNKQYSDNVNLFKTISNQAKELGIQVTELPIYKEYLNSQQMLNELIDINQSNWSLIAQYK